MFKQPKSLALEVNVAVLILRVVIGFFMLRHGMGKLEYLFGDEVIHFPDPLGVGATASLVLTVFAEVFCSVLIILGLLTRFSAITLLFTMVVAAFVVHKNDGFDVREASLLFGLVYLSIALLNAGKYSLDYFLFQPRKRQWK